LNHQTNKSKRILFYADFKNSILSLIWQSRLKRSKLINQRGHWFTRHANILPSTKPVPILPVTLYGPQMNGVIAAEIGDGGNQ
jgi:hypothetical protein